MCHCEGPQWLLGAATTLIAQQPLTHRDVMCDATAALFFCHFQVGAAGQSENTFFCTF